MTDHSQRRDILLNDLFLVVYKRTSRALLYRDHVMLAVLLAQVKLRGIEEITDEMEFLLESADNVVASVNIVTGTTPSSAILSADQALRLENYAKQSIFKPVQNYIIEHESDWLPFLQSHDPEQSVPTPWEPSTRTSYSC